jgi:tripartite-type tricarboxylate transporter receptor subunit TctC
MKLLSKCLASVIAVSALVAAAPAAAADAYPNRPIRLIVPYNAGGSTDMVARRLAELSEPILGQSIIVENRGGAGATLSSKAMVGAKPDGYTLGVILSPTLRMPHIADVGYDPLKDFTYIVALAGYTVGAAVLADSPFKTFSDLVEYAKANPEKITYGTASVGSFSNVMMEETASRHGIKWRHIPFKGESEVIPAVIGGFLDVYAGSTTVLPMVNSGKMRMLVTWGAKRAPQFPDTPTLEEVDGTPPIFAPMGIIGPKGMDPAVAKKLHDVFKQVADTKAFKDALYQFGMQENYMNTEDYAKYAVDQFALEGEIVSKLGLAENKK